jgi:hypothetical protein
MFKSIFNLAVFLPCALGGCGTLVPKISEPWERQDYTFHNEERNEDITITSTGQMEFEIRRRVYCDLKRAVHAVSNIHVDVSDDTGPSKINRKDFKEAPLIPDDWVAQVSLSLQVDESTSFNPGVALNTPIHSAITHFVGESLPNSNSAVGYGVNYSYLSTPQSYAFGLGGSLSAAASRTDKFNPVYSIKNLKRPYQSDNTCLTDHLAPDEKDFFVQQDFTPASSSLLLSSDLGLTEWLTNAMFVNRFLPSYAKNDPPSTKEEKQLQSADVEKRKAQISRQRDGLKQLGYHDSEVSQILAAAATAGGGGGGSPQPDTVSIEIKFVVVTNGNVTPTWKLVRVSANTASSPLFAAGRTRTHDLIITLGPSNQVTTNANLALQIGQAVSGGNRSDLSVR